MVAERSVTPMLSRRKARLEQEAERKELEASLAATRLEIAQAYAGFNAVADPDLVESFVYEIQSLRSRYSYLLRRRKALEPGEEAGAERVEESFLTGVRAGSKMPAGG